MLQTLLTFRIAKIVKVLTAELHNYQIIAWVGTAELQHIKINILRMRLMLTFIKNYVTHTKAGRRCGDDPD